MTLSYGQIWLGGFTVLGARSLLLQQLSQVPAAPHTQPVCDPLDGYGGFSAQFGRQLGLKRMPLAPFTELLCSNPASSESRMNQPLRSGCGRFPKFRAIVPFARLLLNVLLGDHRDS